MTASEPLLWLLKEEETAKARGPKPLRPPQNIEIQHAARALATVVGAASSSLLRAPRVASSTLAALASDRWRLRHPLVVTLEYRDGEVIASWPEVEAWGAGETEAEAINDLKESLVGLCDDILDADESELGKLPLMWRAALRAVVETAS